MFRPKQRWIWAILAPTICTIPTVLWKTLVAGLEGRNYLEIWIAESGQSNLPMAMLACLKSMAPLVASNSTQTLLNIETSGLPIYFTVIIFAIWILGWGQNFYKKPGAVEWYTLFYLGLMSVWFADQGSRFYLPLLPMMVIYAITGLTRLNQLCFRQSKSRILIQTAIVAGLVVMALPLAQLVSGTTLSVLFISLIRNGYVYCLLAALVLVHLSSKKMGFLRRFSPWQVGTAGLLIIYFAIAWAYGASYLVLEHRLISSRQPMLAGYQPYWQMGEWLKNLELTEKPVLAAQIAIVHHASGRIIREPQITDRQTWNRLVRSDYSSVLWLNYPLSNLKSTDRNNDQIGRLIQDNPDNFILQTIQGADPQFRLYYFVPPGSR
ncbi:MAG: hypothetical protein GY869_26305 [Planctomycetes bacterium]|nr:hypothetical protein [Planctomycetota bacterium]